MGICKSKSQKNSQTQFQSSPTLCITPIINQKNKNNKQKHKPKKITFYDEQIVQKEELSNKKSYSPPPKLCFCSTNQSSNKDILYGLTRIPKERQNQVAQAIQSKQMLFGRTQRFSNQTKKGQRDGFKDSPLKQ
ncbi:unnamed protein product [Paramecium sonneborni]|uniref:Uncharacterized protein n=1 Tax=Paramecium sonneborni TaxID=65129 RepID=A0A8S1RMG1_9CILI|nr:unnamed protein product [Paramecium sonneborni]CAD8128608.1 unnamed protein product [Paramecium sonneborni]